MIVDKCLAALAAAVSLLLPAPTGPGVEPGPACPPGSDVGIDEYIVWVDVPGGGNAEIPLRSALACNTSRTITYKTYDATARAGVDYTGVTYGTVTLNAGSTSATVPVRILFKSVPGPDLTFGVLLTSGAKFGDPDAIVTIKFR